MPVSSDFFTSENFQYFAGVRFEDFVTPIEAAEALGLERFTLCTRALRDGQYLAPQLRATPRPGHKHGYLLGVSKRAVQRELRQYGKGHLRCQRKAKDSQADASSEE